MYMEQATRFAIDSLLERYAKVNTSLDDLIRKVQKGQKIEEFELQLVKNELNNLNIVIDSLNTLYNNKTSNLNYYNSLTTTPKGGRRRRNRRKTRKL